jgi:PPM family protein phosphatase
MKQIALPFGIPDWAIVALAMGLLFVVVFAWARRSTKPRERQSIATTPPQPLAASSESLPPASTRPAVSSSLPPASSVRATRTSESSESPEAELPRLSDRDEDEDDEEGNADDATKVGRGANLKELAVPAKQIIYDEDAAIDEHTHPGALILVSGTAQTDKGLRRRRNEDAILVMPEHGVYVVADGMGGYRGGEIASNLAVQSIESAFKTETFDGQAHDGIPRRASELARAIQMANVAILQCADSKKELSGMGTTICAARFSENKQRLYIGHVGDSRLYRLRNGQLAQLTHDHTMRDLGVLGDGASHLSRAVGIWPTVPVDVLLARPRPRDLYLVCSDGLSKMLSDDRIERILHPEIPPNMIVEALIDAANAKGGADNISVIVIRVDDAVTAGTGAAA